MQIRIGHGYDVHKFIDKRKLILGGKHIPHSQGLQGHSDADVLVHAIMDALLGAAGLPDIGATFPDNDEQYKDISSIKLLCEVSRILSQRNWQVGNIDATIVAEQPKLLPYNNNMKQNIADALNVDASCINIKATTEEGLGLGGKGIAAHAVCIITQHAKKDME